jgi:metal-responsive CopG/Arc/MetJ family transcriptional regulator
MMMDNSTKNLARREQMIDACCRDLRRFLEEALAEIKGGVVSVKLRKLLKAELSRQYLAHYAMCLRRILHRYKWKGGTYVIPRRDAELLLQNLDLLCAALKNERKEAQPRQQRHEKRREEVKLIAITLPNDLLRAVDAYAQHMNVSRSEVVREAIRQLIAMRRVLEEISRAKDGALARVAFRLPADMLDAVDAYAARLKTTRSAVVRYAVMQMLLRKAENQLAQASA